MLSAAAAMPAAAMGLPAEAPVPAPASDRAYWVELLGKMAAPVLGNLSAGTLRKNWNMEYAPGWGDREKSSAWLEAFGRLTAGIAPGWRSRTMIPRKESYAAPSVPKCS